MRIEECCIISTCVFLMASMHFLAPTVPEKSTLMNILCNQLNYEEGSVLYNDKDIRELKQAYYALLGYAPQQQGLYMNSSGERFLTYMALLKTSTGNRYERRCCVSQSL